MRNSESSCESERLTPKACTSEIWTSTANPKYRTYTLSNFRSIPQLANFSDQDLHDMEVVARVLPFKTNNYVVDNLIDWSNPRDPIFHLNFPQKGMLQPEHFDQMDRAVRSGDKAKINATAHNIRVQLNPQPAGQAMNVPRLKDGTELPGIQHKYKETALFFASQGQTCHAYCTFCFRWPQFVGMDEVKFAMKESDLLVRYVAEHPEISDVLFTGGDPMVMRDRVFRVYVEALLNADLPHLRTIRIGTKSLSYWPYKFVTDVDADDTLRLFEMVSESGKNLAVMAHFNHPIELATPAVQAAIKRINRTGAQIRTQSPILNQINADAEVWRSMWAEQVRQECFPYFMFLTRDTGAQHYFGVPLARAWEIFSSAMRKVSGLGRTVRALSMSTGPGKIQVAGVATIHGEKVFVLRVIQGRNPEWCYKPFFAKYDEKALWLDDLQPAFGEKQFFFQAEYQGMMHEAESQVEVQKVVGL